MSDLPPGWIPAALCDLLSHTIGGVWGAEPGTDEVDVDVVRVTEMSPDGQIDPSTAARRSISAAQLASRALMADDLLLEKSGGGPRRPVGRVGRITATHRTSVCANFIQLMRVDPDLVAPRYLEHFLRHFHASGGTEPLQTATTNIRNLKTKDYLRVPVPLAPRREQERIIAAVEEHLSHVIAAEAAIRSAERRLKTMRASILEDLARGDWERRPLGEVLISLRNGCFVSRPKADPPGLPILRISAVRPLNLDAADVRYAPDKLERATEYRVHPGDVLFTRYSGNPDYVGACATVPPEGAGLLHPDKLIRGVPDPSLVLGSWIAIVVSASVGRREIEKRLKTTAGQVGIAGSQLKTVPIPLPPVAEQGERVLRWEHCRDAMERLRSDAKSSLIRCEQARRSILAAAFSGQLVAQSPGDEPASVLLEGIRANRAATAPTKRTRKAKP